MNTPLIKLSDNLSPIIRKLYDINIDLTGKDAQALYISKGENSDIYNITDDTYSSKTINNIIIQYPLTDTEVFDEIENTTLNIDAVSILDILPIEVIIKYNQSINSDYIVGIKKGDLFVDILRDKEGNKIGIKLEVKKILGEFFGRNLIKRMFQCTLARGALDSTVEALIASYINDF